MHPTRAYVGGRARRGRSRWLSLAGLALVAVVAVTGCGAVAPDSGREPAEASGPRAPDFLVPTDSLPRGWSESNSQGIDYRTEVCGVDMEPEPPVRATSARWSEGPVGPFLEQHVRVYASPDASDVVAALREALATCTTYESRGTDAASPSATFRVEDLVVPGAPEESVAWRQTSEGDLPITADLLLVRQEQTTVLLMSYAIRDTPDPAVLEGAVAGLRDQGA